MPAPGFVCTSMYCLISGGLGLSVCAFSQVSGPVIGLMLPTSIRQAWKTLTTVPFLAETTFFKLQFFIRNN